MKLLRFWPLIACLLLASLVLVPSALGAASQDSFAPATYSISDWLNWARTAWQYYQPGVGVNSASGLHRATLSWHCFTDWDVGTYIFSVIFARKLNLITDGSGNGDWQFLDRINKILNFLTTRQLSGTPPSGTPYWAYDWGTGEPCSDASLRLTDSGDQGRLLGALHALAVFRPTYSSQVASIFARSRSAFDILFTQLGRDYYSYFMAEGYAAFGYDESAVFNGLNSYSGPYYTVNGQQLPVLNTLAEPFNLGILEGPMIGYAPSSAFLDFANRDYVAQMRRWSATGNLTAWSEGVYLPGINYIDEWVLETFTSLPETWVMRDEAGVVYLQPQYEPFAYTKVAFSFLAAFGENAYTRALVNAVMPIAGSNGFGEAVFENGTSAMSRWSSDTGGFYTDKTNEQVLAAAAYAISNTTISRTSSLLVSSTSTYTSFSGSTTEGPVGSTMSTSTSNIISPPPTLAPIPSFPCESIMVGIILGLSILVMWRSRRTRQAGLRCDPKYFNPYDSPLALKNPY